MLKLFKRKPKLWLCHNCGQEIKDGEALVTRLSTGHSFHYRCYKGGQHVSKAK